MPKGPPQRIVSNFHIRPSIAFSNCLAARPAQSACTEDSFARSQLLIVEHHHPDLLLRLAEWSRPGRHI